MQRGLALKACREPGLKVDDILCLPRVCPRGLLPTLKVSLKVLAEPMGFGPVRRQVRGLSGPLAALECMLGTFVTGPSGL